MQSMIQMVALESLMGMSCQPRMVLDQITLHFWDTYQGTDVPFAPGAVHYETLKVQLDPGVGNDYQFDGIDLTIEATITQVL